MSFADTTTISRNLPSFVLDRSHSVTKSMWTSVQSKLPKHMFNFSVKYFSISLSTRSNLKKWDFPQSSECSFCHLPETLLHVVAGCKFYLEEGRYTWRQISALQILANYFIASPGSSLYLDLPCFHSTSIIKGENFQPNPVLASPDNRIYILEFTVGFETNLEVYAERKILSLSIFLLVLLKFLAIFALPLLKYSML